MTISAHRRTTSKLLVAGALSAVMSGVLITPAAGVDANFPDGVASRASSRSAILWTRTDAPGEFKYRVSKQRDLTPAVAKGPVTADPDDDNTIKKTVKDLDPATRYYYRFISDNSQSSRGTFKTLPAASKVRDIEVAVTGDSDVLWTGAPYDPEVEDGIAEQERPFSVLDRIREERPNLFIYMGDTMYSDTETETEPLAETIEEKWEKYRENRLPATKSVLKKISTWAVWDDHEIVNDFDGAELINDDPDLFNAGLGAFRDYWPIPDRGKMYRKVDYGREIDMIFLDERRYREESADIAPTPCREGGTGSLDLAPTMPEEDRADDPLNLPPADPDCIALLKDPDRSMLGDEQLDWFKDKLRNSNARWKLVINEVPISELFVRPYDRWEGYLGERNKILSFINRRNIRGVVFLTTDLHANIGSHVYKSIANEDSKPITYESIVGPIQTCSLDCEVDKILGTGIGGETLRGFLENHDLTDADCINIDVYGYGLFSTRDRTDRLKLEYKSYEPRANGPGGKDVFGCPDEVLRPSVSG
jgi:alkaline phosphatase D